MTATISANNAMLQQQIDAREARQQQQITEQFAAMTASLQTMMRKLITNRPENIEIPSIQSPPPQPPQQSQMHLHAPSQTPTQSLPALPVTNASHLRAEEVGYFDPEYQQDHGSSSNGPVVNVGKHVFYKDVYICTNRFKDLAVQRGEADTKTVVSSCLRGTALMWYSMELTDLERDLLRDANLNQ